MSDPIRTAAILSTGDEIVGGRTVDTNSSYLADRLATLGIDVVAILAVSDDVDRITWAWEQAREQADLILSTGGLGPTSDDLTTETVARVAGVELRMDERQAERIREMFRVRGRAMPENNLRQALIPQGAAVIDNPTGTAPGYRIELAAGFQMRARSESAESGVQMRAHPEGAKSEVQMRARSEGAEGGVQMRAHPESAESGVQMRAPSVGGAGRVVHGVVLPGVPREMKVMFEETVYPWIAGRVEPGRVVVSRTFQTFGMPESALDQALRGAIPATEARLAFRASFPKISVRISAAGASDAAAATIDRLAAVVRERLGTAIYAEGDASMEEVVGELLKRSGKTVVTAESCTGGLLGSRLTDVPGSSSYYMGGLVAYTNDLKQRLLGVSSETLQKFGAVSVQTVAEMAVGAAQRCGADLGVATSGIAGPGGGTPDKPVGTVAMALAHRSGGNGYAVDAKVYSLWGSRDWIKLLTTQVALDWIRRHELGLPALEPAQLSSRPAPKPASAAGSAGGAEQGAAIG